MPPIVMNYLLQNVNNHAACPIFLFVHNSYVADDGKNIRGQTAIAIFSLFFFHKHIKEQSQLKGFFNSFIWI